MDIGWKIASAGSMALSAMVANKLVEGGWKLVTGNPIPREDDDNVQIVQLLAFAALSAVCVSFIQRYAIKGAKKWYGPGQIDD